MVGAPRSQIALSVGVGADGVPPEAWGWLPLLTGVALVDAVRATTGIEAGVKWPNDILVGTGKLAGILAEVAAPDPVIVVGLGSTSRSPPRRPRIRAPPHCRCWAPRPSTATRWPSRSWTG